MIMSFTKPLHGFSFDCPWFNRLVSLHRLLTGLHPVDICFLNNRFRAFWPSYFLGALFSKCEFRSLVQQEFFRAFICQNIGLPIDNLCFAVCSFGECAMSLDHLDMIVSKAENKMLVIIRTRDYKLFIISCHRRI